ncbi:101 kDa malaria antigen-like [Drosophila miranda]|uniref:101 kDa malaria antigen-like n=1 Tax=Drosophila miranda TaxID=7229 RepID=UPI00143F6B6E|nr:101 kDa malaria antigen-like [Drosophila miranda]
MCKRPACPPPKSQCPPKPQCPPPPCKPGPSLWTKLNCVPCNRLAFFLVGAGIGLYYDQMKQEIKKAQEEAAKQVQKTPKELEKEKKERDKKEKERKEKEKKEKAQQEKERKERERKEKEKK